MSMSLCCCCCLSYIFFWSLIVLSRMVKPLSRPSIVKKKGNKFVRYQSNRFMRVGRSWRKPKGDCSFILFSLLSLSFFFFLPFLLFCAVVISLSSLSGIDSRLRRRFRGSQAQPKIGYGSNNRTKYLLRNGFKKFTIKSAFFFFFFF